MSPQDNPLKAKGKGEEAAFAHKKEHEQLTAIRKDLEAQKKRDSSAQSMDKDYEGGYGGQEDLEDRYATTSGEH